MRALLRVGALSALAALGGGCSEDPTDRLVEVARLGLDRDPEAISRLESLVADPDANVRALAIATLSRLDPQRAEAPATKGLGDAAPAVRAASARALGAGKVAGSVPALAARLRNDASWEVRRRAAEALGAIGGEGAAAPLRQGLLDPEPDVRVAAARAIAATDPVASVRACGFVMKTDDSWAVRLEAARALKKAATPEAVALLAEAASDPNEFVRAEVARALKGGA